MKFSVKWCVKRCSALLALWLMSPLLLAAGMQSPEAIAQTFAEAYRKADSKTIVEMQYFGASKQPFVDAKREQQAWLRQVSHRRLLSYKVVNLMGRDQSEAAKLPLQNHKKLVIEYETHYQGRMTTETYWIGQKDGLFYLLPAHYGHGGIPGL